MNRCIVSFLFLIAFLATAQSYDIHESFTKCITTNSDKINNPSNTTYIYTRNDSSYTAIYESTAQNPRCLLPNMPRPILIYTPPSESHVAIAVTCARKLGIQLRLRSGGHDYEGISYTSEFKPTSPPFVLIDLRRLRAVNVDSRNNTAWVQAGATLGELYYRISQASSTLGFPAGVCNSVGIGGYITGGGYGTLMRKYGLAADNTIDARIVNVDGKILDRRLMGDDLFWAIRGGGGGSFGIILAWKVRLVRVPSTVTVFNVPRTLQQGATKILLKYQLVADKLDENLFVRAFIQLINDTTTGKRMVGTSYNALYLGRANNLLRIMKRDFPELGLAKNDTIELSWIQSALFMSGYDPINTPPEILLEAQSLTRTNYFKAKSDYVREPIPENGLEGLWKILLKEDSPTIIWNPYGGMMSRISESEIPYPNRKGVIFMAQYATNWQNANESVSEHYNWIRGLYEYMAPYVSRSPREAYVNYRDMDLGMNQNFGKNTSFKQASEWGFKYFKNNFNRLVAVKTKVDPSNFFWHEQSIPVFN